MTETAEVQEAADPGRTPQAFWPAMRRLAGLFAPYKAILVLAVAITIVTVGLHVWAPLVLRDAVNALFHADGIDFGLLRQLIIRVLAMYVIAMTLMWWQGRVLIIVGVEITYVLRQDVEHKVHRLPTNWFDGTQRGALLSRTAEDVATVQTGVQQTVSSLLNGLLTIIGITAMMLWLSWQLALIALIAVPIAAGVVGILGKRAQKLFSAQWANTGKIGRASCREGAW